MKCPKCEGKGYNYRHRNCNHDTHDAYVRGCNNRVMCKYCNGIGAFNLGKAITSLKYIIFRTDGEVKKEAEYVLKCLTETEEP